MTTFITYNNKLLYTLLLSFFTCAHLILSAVTELISFTGVPTTLHGNHWLPGGALDQKLESLTLIFLACNYLSNFLSPSLSFFCKIGIITPISQSACEEQHMKRSSISVSIAINIFYPRIVNPFKKLFMSPHCLLNSLSWDSWCWIFKHPIIWSNHTYAILSYD